jgi:FlaA1/EpsC-like NDP-sugar epimerase
VRDDNNTDGDIEIHYTGLRPGEKLYEELLIGDNVIETEHQKIMRAEEITIAWSELQKVLKALDTVIENNDSEGLRQLLLNVVDGFVPQCGIEDWLFAKQPSLNKV